MRNSLRHILSSPAAGWVTAIAAIVTTVSCSHQYNIDGNSNVDGLDGQTMYLCMASSDGTQQTVRLDSCQVVHGTFNFGGAIDSVAMAELYMGGFPMMPVVLENGSLFIQMDNVAQTITGGPLNDRLSKFLAKRNRCESNLWDLDRRARMMVYEGRSVDQIVVALDPIKQKILSEMQALDTQFIKDNYDNVLGPGYFMRIGYDNAGMPRVDSLIIDILSHAPAAFLQHPCVSNFISVSGIDPQLIISASSAEKKPVLRRAPKKPQ